MHVLTSMHSLHTKKTKVGKKLGHVHIDDHINGFFFMNVDPKNHINHDMNDHKMFI